MSYGYTYQTTNLLDGKKYIGKKKGKFNSNYLGSGLRLGRAINKHGRENFKVVLLSYLDTRDQLNKEEIHLIKEVNACKSDNYYNIAPGGEGGDITTGYTKEEFEEFKRKSNMWNTWDKDSPEGIAVRKKFSNPGSKNGMYGVERKDLKKMSSKKLKCPHCGTINNIGNLTQWHFENCRNK